MEILNLKGDPNHITGLRDAANLLKGWILPIGEVASRRVCTSVFRKDHFFNILIRPTHFLRVCVIAD